jgi:hypothetical protein
MTLSCQRTVNTSGNYQSSCVFSHTILPLLAIIELPLRCAVTLGPSLFQWHPVQDTVPVLSLEYAPNALKLARSVRDKKKIRYAECSQLISVYKAACVLWNAGMPWSDALAIVNEAFQKAECLATADVAPLTEGD